MPELLEIVWRSRARADLKGIINYISDDNPVAAGALERITYTKILRLPENPLAYRVGRVAQTREMVVHPNYIVVYSVSSMSITILRVLHAAQNRP